MKNTFLLLTIIISLSVYSQREITAVPKSGPIVLDGILNEEDWQHSNWSKGFTQMRPNPGAKAAKKTEVAVLFDKEAIYFGVKML